MAGKDNEERQVLVLIVFILLSFLTSMGLSTSTIWRSNRGPVIRMKRGIYIAVLFWQTFIKAYGSYQRSQHALIKFNLIPFKTILHYTISFNQKMLP